MQTVLENKTVRAEFAPSGALIGLTAKNTGWPIQRRPELGLSFEMLLPLPDRRNNVICGSDQELPELEKTGDRLVITWCNLKSRHGGIHDITFRGTVRLKDDELTFIAEIANNSDYTVETLSWPCVGDLSRPAGTTKFQTGHLYYNLMLHGELYPEFLCNVGYWGVDYPTQTSPVSSTGSPFYFVQNDKEGLYIGYHDQPVSRMLQYTFQLKPGWIRCDTNRLGTVPEEDELNGEPVRIEFQAVHYPYCNSGERVALSPVVLAPYVGTWHKGVDHYKAWRDTWFERPQAPAWLRSPHSWQLLHINSPEGELRCRYKDLVQYAESAKRHGVTAIQLVGWTKDGQDGGNPSHDIDSRLGTTEELKAAIAQCQALGVRIVLFSKFTWADQSTDWYRDEGIRYTAKDCYGDPYPAGGYQYQTWTQLANINTRRIVPLCHADPESREMLLAEFRKVTALGAAGTLYDEGQHHHFANYCFDREHEHHQPAYNHLGDQPLIDAFKRVASEADPDYLFAGEGLYDQQLQSYHLTYHRTDGLNSTMLHRYIDPEAGMMMAICGYRERNNINFALMHKMIISHEPRLFKGTLEEYPDTVAYARHIDDLRRRYQDRLWDAEYRDVLGATVTADGKPHRYYSVFVTPAGLRTVVASNFETNRTLAIRIELDGAAIPALTMVTPENPEMVACAAGEVELPPESVVVAMEPE
jgi:hypothetical protein